MSQVLEIDFHGRREYPYWIQLISWLLVTWWHKGTRTSGAMDCWPSWPWNIPVSTLVGLSNLSRTKNLVSHILWPKYSGLVIRDWQDRQGGSWHIEAKTKWPPFSRRHFQIHFLEWKCMNVDWKFTEISPINNIPALVQIMAWRWPGDKPLSEPMLVSLLRHTCVILSPKFSKFLLVNLWKCIFRNFKHKNHATMKFYTSTNSIAGAACVKFVTIRQIIFNADIWKATFL